MKKSTVALLTKRSLAQLLALSTVLLPAILLCATSVHATDRYIIGFNNQSLRTATSTDGDQAVSSNNAEFLAAKLNEALAPDAGALKSNSGDRKGMHVAVVAERAISLNNQTMLVVNASDSAINELAQAAGNVSEKDSSILSAISYIEEDELVSANGFSNTPNDWLYYSLWALQSNQHILAPQAWEITSGSTDVVVAVIDTGIDHQHADLAANMWINIAEIQGNGIDDDANGVVDDVYGYDPANEDGDPMDDQGHGTHVAGTIGAIGNNGNGVIGVAPSTKLMGCKFLSATGSGYTSDAIACLAYIVEMKNRGVNIKVTNNSWGGGGYSQALKDAIAATHEAGILFIAAAGNNGRNTDSTIYYPQGYDVPNVLSVAATDSSGNLASFSNYGATTVDVGAPGVSILSTYKGNQYGTMSGTSMATPHVAGVAALLYAVNPNLTPVQSVAIIKETGTNLGSLAGKTVTGKLTNARAAVEKAIALGNAPASLSGRALVAGMPLQGASVTAVINGVTNYATTDSNGQYSFADLVSGASYSITISKSGYSFTPASASGVLSGDVIANFTGTLGSYTITGRVALSNNSGVAAAVAVNVNGALSTVMADASGSFSVANLPHGASYTLTPSLAGYSFTPGSYSGTATASSTINFQATPVTFSLSGVVTFSSGKGVSGAVVRFGALSTTTGANGSYTLSGISGGTSGTLSVTKEGYSFSPRSHSVQMSSDQIVNFTVASVKTYAFGGTVKNSRGQSIAGAVIVITGSDGVARATTSSRSGTFTVRNLPVGELQVTVVARGHQSFTGAFSLARNSTRYTATLTPLNYSLFGVVRTAQGAPLSGALIRISGVGAQTALVSGADGSFSISVPHGSAPRVAVSKINCRMKPGTVTTKIDAANKLLAPFVATCR